MPSKFLRSSGHIRLPLLATGIIAATVLLGRAQSPLVKLQASVAGVGILNQRLMVAVPIGNVGPVKAENVKVTGVTLGAAHLLSPATFPVALGTIWPGQSSTFQADFDATALSHDVVYSQTITGTYQVNEVSFNFTLSLETGLPPASPGFGATKTGMAQSEDLSGAPFQADPSPFEPDDDFSIPVPIGPFIADTPTLPNVSIQSSLPSSQTNRQAVPLANSNASAVVVRTNDHIEMEIKGGLAGDPVEPSGGSGGGVVLLSFNRGVAYKAHGDHQFTILDPRTMFPQTPYPFQHDQQVQFVHSINRFVWIQQLSLTGPGSPGAYRLAWATPEAIKRNRGKTKAWQTRLLTHDTFGLADNTEFDMPSLAIGDQYLYASWDVGCPNKVPTNPEAPKCNGVEVVRILLSDIAANRNPLPLEHVTDPGMAGGCPPHSASCVAHNTFLSQDTGDEVFWAGHNSNTQLRVFRWAEGSSSYFWKDVGGIPSYNPNGKGGTKQHVASPAPAPIYLEGNDSNDWLYRRPESPIHGIARVGAKVYFAWNAAPLSPYTHPYIELVVLDTSNYSWEHQRIGSPSVALGLASLATNACQEVGISLGYGGGKEYPNFAVGFVGDDTYYGTTEGSVTGSNYGDYVNIRQNHTDHPNGANFDAFGYALTRTGSAGSAKKLTSGQVNADIHYVVFGRPRACSQ